MKTFEQLNEIEIALRNLIYAVETKDKKHPNHPVPLGEAFLKLNLERAKEIAKKEGIPLVEIDF